MLPCKERYLSLLCNNGETIHQEELMCMELITKIPDKSDRTEKGSRQIQNDFWRVNRQNKQTQNKCTEARTAPTPRHLQSTPPPAGSARQVSTKTDPLLGRETSISTGTGTETRRRVFSEHRIQLRVSGTHRYLDNIQIFGN